MTDVSADTITDERGTRFYRVNVEVNTSAMASRIRQPGSLIPGMAASADIVVGKRTILSYILSPLLKFRDGAFRAAIQPTIPDLALVPSPSPNESADYV